MKRVLLILMMLPNAFFAFSATVDFYGHSINFTTTYLDQTALPTTFNEVSLKTASIALDKKISANLYSQIENAVVAYNLDDVGTVLLVQKMSEAAVKNKNLKQLLQFKVLSHLNYDVRLTYTANKLSCFGVLQHSAATAVYLFFDEKKYTKLDFNDLSTEGTRYIYKSEINEEAKVIETSNKLPKINAHKSERKLAWVFQGKVYQLNATSNNSITEYLSDRPLLELGKSYILMPHSNEFETTVLNPLRDYMKTMSTNDQKADFLLHFVQSAFAYKTDGDQYGHEKYNFPEETIASNFSDCEDRVLLLAYLYKKLLGFNSVMLDFGSAKHVALGVEIPGHSNSWSFKYNKKPYIFCEPTGLGYDLGESYFQLSAIAEVIELY